MEITMIALIDVAINSRLARWASASLSVFPAASYESVSIKVPYVIKHVEVILSHPNPKNATKNAALPVSSPNVILKILLTF